MEKLPKLILLDAVGTLFGVRGSVGEAYRQIAAQFGVFASAEALNQAFFQAFVASPIMAFPGADPDEIPPLEFQWWKAIAIQTFQTVGQFDQFTDFPQFFQQLYDYFATQKPWFVYPDVPPNLEKWQSAGIELGVLSNFDSRLYPVLEALDLARFFTSITISTEVGAAKPSSQMFHVALKKHHCSPTETWHIGDSFKADYQGAKAVGIYPILIDRDEQGEKANLNEIQQKYTTLTQLNPRLGFED